MDKSYVLEEPLCCAVVKISPLPASLNAPLLIFTLGSLLKMQFVSSVAVNSTLSLSFSLRYIASVNAVNEPSPLLNSQVGLAL